MRFFYGLMNNEIFVVLLAMVILFSTYVAVTGILGGILWTYSINTLIEIAGKPNRISFWNGFILGIIPGVGQLCLPLSVVTFVAHQFY